MKKLLIITVMILTLMFFSCATDDNTSEPEDNTNNNQNTTAEPIEEFEVTEELYSQTFDEITEIISKLNNYIANKDYNDWLRFLSEKYKKTMSDPSILADYSETPILKNNNIALKTLQDYFKWVVVPSRSNVRLDELDFKDEAHVTAYMVIEGKSIILYQLEKIDDNWKITVW